MSTPCPEKQRLADYATGRLSEDLAVDVERHVSDCPTCDATLHSLEAASDTLVSGLKQPKAAEPYVDEPDFKRAAAQAERLPDEPPKTEALSKGEQPTAASQPAPAGQPATSKAPPQLGPYRLLAKLGEGGMGAVYKAQHEHLEKLVAIKVLPKAAMNDKAAVDRFRREMKAVGRLHHPNIVTAHDAGEHRGVHFLVMEYVEGSDLSSLVKKQGPVPIDKATSYILQAARGLAFAHSKGIIHRDIKPANLLVDDEGTIKILDMGLARLDGDNASKDAKDGLTQTGQVMGTVDYMAPEQAFDTHRADAKADVYSLGCTLFRIVTGKNAFDGDTLVQKILAHRENAIPALSSPHGPISDAVEMIYRRMMGKKPDERPTMAEVVTALEALSAKPQAAEQAAASIVIDVTKKPALAASLATRSPSRAKPNAKPHASGTGRKPPQKVRVAAAAAGAFALIALGVWLVVRNDRGEVVAKVEAPPGTRIEVPSGGSVEVLPGPVPMPIATAKVTGGLTSPAQQPPTFLTPSTNSSSAGSPGGYALSFGDGASVEMPSLKDAIDPAKPLTVECWVTNVYAPKGKPGVKFTGEVPVLGFNHGPPFYWVINNSGNWTAYLPTNEFVNRDEQPSGVSYATAAPNIARNNRLVYINANGDPFIRRWHLAVVRTEKKVSFYSDGKLRQSIDIPAVTLQPAKDSFLLGGATGTPARFFHGLIDEVRISQTARYEQDFTPAEQFAADAETTALYHFDEGTGDVLVDASGNNHHGQIFDATWVRADGSANLPPVAVPAVTPPGEYALEFDGQYSQAPYEELVARNVAIPADSLWTVEGYVTLQSDLVNYTGPFLSWNGIGFRHLRGQELRFGAFGAKPPLQKRFHFACVAATTDTKLFFDGELVGSKPWPTDPPVRGDPKHMDFKIYGPGVIGRFHQLRISTTARYDRDFTPAPTLAADADTLLCYLFREGSGDVVHDSSGHGHDATIVGAKWVRADGSAIPPTASVATVSTAGDNALPPKFTNSIGMEFVLVPKGKAWLGGGGGKPGTKEFAVSRDFYLGTYEVTQGEWQAVMKNNPSAYKRNNPNDTRPEALAVKDITDEELKRFPVEGVSGYDCVKFVDALNAATQESGWFYRLPTSDEWEYACRGGPMTDPAESGFDYYFDQPVVKALPGQLNSGTPPAVNRPCRVGSYAPNRLGLFDMHGNVREWCRDLLPASPSEVDGLSRRLSRGGHWNETLTDPGLRAGTVGPSKQWMSFPYMGLRLARVPATTPVSAVIRPEPGVDYALYFDGIRSSVAIPSLPLDGPEWTVEVTAAIDGPPIVGTIVRGLGNGFAAWVETGPAVDEKHFVQAVLRGAGTTNWSSHVTLTSGQRVHYAMVMRNGKIDLYHDGRRLAEGRSETAKAVTESSKAFTIGAWEDNGLMTRLFEGTIDEVRISKKARFDGDYKPQDRLDADPDTVALYHFDDGVGDVLKDSSGNNHHGKIVGATWVRADGSAITVTPPPGDYALQFDGVDDHVDLANIVLDSAKPFTIEAAVQTTENARQMQIVSNEMGDRDVLLAVNPDRVVGIIRNSANGPNNQFSPTGSRTIDEDRHYAAFVWDGKKAAVYWDGQIVATDDKDHGPVVPSNVPLRIGARPIPNDPLAFDGRIDEVRISKVARYATTYTPQARLESDADTTALYHFDEGTGDVLKDSSGNNHHGKIIGATWVRADGGQVPSAGTSGIAAPEGFVSLFNGRDLTGWKTHPALPGEWRVEDGVLKGSGKDPSFLFSERDDFKNFHLRCEARVGRGTSAGIYGRAVRPQVFSAKKYAPGYVAKINADFQGDPQKTGSLYVMESDTYAGVNPGRPSPVGPDAWFTMDVIVNDNRLQIMVNGQTTTAHVDARRLYAQGHIALQFHQGTSAIEFRKIEIRELNADGSAVAAAGGLPAPVVIADRDRRLAHWTIERGGIVGLRVVATNKSLIDIKRLEDLPAEPFRLTSVVLTDKSSGFIWTDADLLSLRELKELYMLGANWTRLTAQGVAGLSAIEDLRFVILVGENKSADAWKALLTLQNLDTVDLQGTRVTPEQVASLKALPKLRTFSIGYDPQVSVDAALARVQELPAVTLLSLRNVSDAGVDGLTKLVKLETLILEFPTITDAGLAQLGALTSLKTLTLNNAKVSAAGVAALQKLLPTCKIEWDDPAAAPPPAVAPFDAAQARAHQEAWAKHLGTQVETVNPVGAKMILIPPGEFLMGSSEAQVAGAQELAKSDGTDETTQTGFRTGGGAREQPQHRVVLTQPYLMGATEVTVGEFRKFVDDTKYVTEAEKAAAGQPPPAADAPAVKNWREPGYTNSDDLPVTVVTWSDAKAYCEWLTTRDPSGVYRLPSEAEWEFACRGGTTTQFSFGDDPALFDRYGWCGPKHLGRPQPVGGKLPNPFGLFDMHGSVAETCRDGLYKYEGGSNGEPELPIDQYVVVRGGEWYHSSLRARSAYRMLVPPNALTNSHGFRVVRTLNGAAKSKTLDDPAFLAWLKATQALPAEQQLVEVSKKLMELNPEFDGELTGVELRPEPKIENGVVVELGFLAIEVTDLSPVRALAGLKKLSCSGRGAQRAKLSDLSPLVGLHLDYLAITGSDVADLTPLQGMPLTTLLCAGSRVENLSPLRGAPLTRLLCKGTRVTDLAPLQGMPLKTFECNGFVTDLAPLAGMPLVSLSIEQTQATDLKPLETCKALKTLKVGAKINAEQIAALQKVLPDCKIEVTAPATPTGSGT